MNNLHQHASLRRRLGAFIYDAIAVTTVLYFAGFIPVLIVGDALPPGNPFLSVYLLLVMFAYFAACWRRGRTLGMQAWKLQIQTTSGKRPGLAQCVIRFLGAGVSLGLAGAGYFVAALNPQRVTWHDRWSQTRLLRAGVTYRSDT